MGLFDFFKSGTKKEEIINEKDRLMQPVEVVPDLFFPFVVAQYWDQIRETRLESIAIKATPSRDLTFQNSSFGHKPFLPADFPYPTDKEGKPMFPLAQINFSEAPHLHGYPTSGYLQFYISASDGSMGINYDNFQSQENFRVLYFEEGAITRHQTGFPFLNEMYENGNLPLAEPFYLEFSTKTEYVGLGDVRRETSGNFDLTDLLDKYPIASREIEEFIYENFAPNGHKIGGYAFFTQEDPRIYDEKIKDFILLLQIDTDNHIMWGDSGVGNFFIHPDDLAKKDFSKVAYSWDCC